MIALMLVLLAGSAAAGTACGATNWQKHHPRQHRVVTRARHQLKSTGHAVGSGKLTHKQASRLNHEDHGILSEDRRDARINGGYITKGEAAHAASQEKHLRRQRRHDEKVDATSH
jgi:hypothetical protein